MCDKEIKRRRNHKDKQTFYTVIFGFLLIWDRKGQFGKMDKMRTVQAIVFGEGVAFGKPIPVSSARRIDLDKVKCPHCGDPCVDLAGYPFLTKERRGVDHPKKVFHVCLSLANRITSARVR